MDFVNKAFADLRNMKNYLFVFLLLSIFFSSISIDAQNFNSLPTIEKKTGFSHLMVNGKPWIMLSGELHNSSASNLEYMESVWDKLVDMHLNTAIATVSWELFEPVEGKYDYTLVDGIIKGAREHQLKLVLIWFGTWKNTWSTYAPEWVKTDLKRFPRMQTKPVENSGALSAFGGKTCIADARAFTELMKHIGEIDSKDQTVLMMQVENETGVLNTSRDRSDLAETEFIKPIPVAAKYVGQVCSAGKDTKGNWKGVYGKDGAWVFGSEPKFPSGISAVATDNNVLTPLKWPEGVRHFSYRKDPVLPDNSTGMGFATDNVQIAFNVIPLGEDGYASTPKGTMPKYVGYKCTDYEYALNQVAPEFGGGTEIWRLLVPGMPEKHFYPRQPKSPFDGSVKNGKLAVTHEGSTRITECAIPWSELPDVKKALDAGQTIKFSFRVNDNENMGSCMELASERSISKKNSRAFHASWKEHWANEVEFGFEK